MAWHGMAWHGMAWHGMAWHEPTLRNQSSATQYIVYYVDTISLYSLLGTIVTVKLCLNCPAQGSNHQP